MNWDDIAKGIIKKAGVAGIKELESLLGDLKEEAKEPWKAAILQIAVEAIDKYGLKGVEYAEKLVDRVAKGKEPDLSFASLKARSDYLAAIQNMEADEKKKAKDFLKVVGQKLGTIIRAIIAGLLAG